MIQYFFHFLAWQVVQPVGYHPHSLLRALPAFLGSPMCPIINVALHKYAFFVWFRTSWWNNLPCFSSYWQDTVQVVLFWTIFVDFSRHQHAKLLRMSGTILSNEKDSSIFCQTLPAFVELDGMLVIDFKLAYGSDNMTVLNFFTKRHWSKFAWRCCLAKEILIIVGCLELLQKYSARWTEKIDIQSWSKFVLFLKQVASSERWESHFACVVCAKFWAVS